MRSLIFLTLAALVLQSSAHPASPARSYKLHKRAVDFNRFRLKLTSDYSDATQTDSEPSIAAIKRADPEDTATELVKRSIPGATFRLVDDFYVGDNGISHFNFKQTANGLDIDNADFNVNIGRNGEVFSFGNSFYKKQVSSLRKRENVDAVTALKGAVNALQLPVKAEQASAEAKDGNEVYAIKKTSGAAKEPEARLVYLQTPGGDLTLTWRIETDILSNWLLTYMDAATGEEIHAVVDYSADATYEVYPWGLNDPTEGERVVVEDPYNPVASEFGWHSTGDQSYTVTRGNNGIAQINPSGGSGYLNNPRPDGGEDLKFEFPYSLNETNPLVYQNASITQLFYTANVYHDLLHQLGFNERAGNFEVNNNGAGGVGNDFVILNSQDGSGTNNANFATPPDGQPGRMRMYMWNKSMPFRDCAFEAGVVIHEYTHGLSNRLTGGPANSGCLGILEAGGMGEGWSDFMATAIRLKPKDTRETDYPMGAWVNNNASGIRPYLYSTDMKVNPHIYSDVDPLEKVHFIGTVWATMLYEVLWNLIDKHGKNDAGTPDFENGVPTDGKYLAMKLVMDGMALQPCNPNFVSARDAILDADKALTDGDNACEIWTGFAKRGLGADAVYNTDGRTDSFEVPEDVC
ncbi:extracellular metallo proteinase mep [Polyplosphaeria fusca]|uniref:Extracellular metalloproteinase n=1 Tax=Polyplosphaeria fusca TaxID=682080 RepID=A0A9P4V6U0_9PLEO|nr:extracellular metallo proteinase mep [Polyplosphaeria fusca]